MGEVVEQGYKGTGASALRVVMACLISINLILHRYPRYVRLWAGVWAG